MVACTLFVGCAGSGDGDAPTTESKRAAISKRTNDTPEAALARLYDVAGGDAVVATHKATGSARFVRVPPDSDLAKQPAANARAAQDQSLIFFRDYGLAMGVDDPGSLRLVSTTTDALGETHLTFKQTYAGLPVFGTMLKSHFDAGGRLKIVGGTAVPGITVNPVATWSSQQARGIAQASVVSTKGNGVGLRTGTAKLLLFREGLAQGIPGPTHLAWEIEVTDGAGIRELVYVSAQTGKVIDTITGIQDDLFRRAYDGHGLPAPPTNYPNGAFWTEGDHFPTAFTEANNMIVSSGETYHFFDAVFGRDSFDDLGTKMDSIFNRGYGCPNASWNGTFISFCPGFTTDDVTAHEWGHAYTQYTHGLIYQWQPGALNESYSDIWGETVDVLNGTGHDTPAPQRNAGQCSSFSPPVAKLRVNSPAAIARDYFAQSAFFGPPLSATGITNDVVAALDAGPVTTDGCTAPFTNAAAVAGKIALIDRGACEFSTKVWNAQQAGAIGVIIANNAVTGLPGMGPGVDAPKVTIPSIGVQQATGNSIRGQLANGAVNATMLAEPGQDVSYRWLVGEDLTGAFNGALRDMWNPTCYSNPGKVSDPFYWCTPDDSGGVHINSGIPNRGYALLVDGGETVAPIGLTKAAHIYFRAQDTYQVSDSDFTDHANALAQSCADLVGAPLTALTGGPSSEVITDADCDQVDLMAEAVQLRAAVPCVFPPLLNPGNATTLQTCHPAMTTGVTTSIASFDFEAGEQGFVATMAPATPTFTPRNWTRVDTLPNGADDGPAAFGNGFGWFGPTPNIGDCQLQGEAGVLYLTSPEIVLPASTSFARANFEQWFGLEPGFDGGNLSVSVNGGPFQLLGPSEFTFNGYLFLLFTAAQGNTNPLAGQPAWTTTRQGSVSEGSWGRSFVNLGNFARAGDRVRLRWNLGTDGCAGRDGWYMDNVQVYSCEPRVPELTIADIQVNEGNAGSSTATFTVRLNPANTGTIRAITVNYQTVNGTAGYGNDYDRVTSGTLVIPASTNSTLVVSGAIPITIKGDTVSEGPETFTLRVTNVVNATMADREAVATIVDDDAP
jgi:Zn-dependent metalloprotease